MCIYYTSRNDLTYDGEEHVFPAGLGGKTMLPKGYVSDQFNQEISKLERKFCNESLFSFPRQFEGPGSRGRLGERHESRSGVLLSIDEGKDKFSLVYIKKGVFHTLPLIEINTNPYSLQLHLPAENPEVSAKMMDNFHAQLQQLEERKTKRINDDRIPKGRILVTLQSGIRDNLNCFIFKNENTPESLTEGSITQLFANINFEKIEVTHPEKFQVKVTQEAVLNDQIWRVPGKIALNYFALQFGKEAALNPMFDAARHWIAGINSSFTQAGAMTNYDPFPAITKKLSKDYHSVLLYPYNGDIIARVTIYFFPIHITLAEKVNANIPVTGMVIDYKNGREIPMGEFLQDTH
jgi:hypothetical protein